MKKGQTTGVANPGRIELTGQKIGRLTVLAPVRIPGKEQLHYACQCECGNTKVILAQSLRKGTTQSCGCLRAERVRTASLRHGMSKTTIHNAWLGMIQRCTDPKAQAYPDYGGRGISVCERWMTFENFLADMGEPPQPGLSLDRYPDNDGNYEPGNVRWATKKEQANNRRSSKLLTYNGQTLTQAQWEDKYGLRRGALWERLDRGWTLERALTTPQVKHVEKPTAPVTNSALSHWLKQKD